MRKSEHGEETGEADIRREGLCVYVRCVCVCVFVCVRLFVSVYQWVGGCMLLGACTKSCTRKLPVLIFQLPRYSARVLKLYYKVASSQLPAPQIAPRTKVVLQSRQFSASSSPDCTAY